jgi:maltose O-acetyltransferase
LCARLAVEARKWQITAMREGSSPGADHLGEDFAGSEDWASGPKWIHRMASLGTRIVRAGRLEFEVDLGKIAGRIISRGLPQFSFVRTRTALLRAAGIRIGAHSLVMGPLNITGEGSVRDLFSVGDDSFITGPLHVDLGGSVHIGNRVRLGHHVLLLTVDHEVGPPEQRCGQRLTGPIVIDDGVWVASRVTILPGVRVGYGAIVAAGAVVTRDVLPNTLVGGVPARLIRALDEDAHESSRRVSQMPRN